MLIELSKGSRQPKRARLSLERLNHERSIALGYAIDSRSHLAYTSALNSYISFCNLHEFPIEPTENTLSYFTVYVPSHLPPVCGLLSVWYLQPTGTNLPLRSTCQQKSPCGPNIAGLQVTAWCGCET